MSRPELLIKTERMTHTLRGDRRGARLDLKAVSKGPEPLCASWHMGLDLGTLHQPALALPSLAVPREPRGAVIRSPVLRC